MRGLVDREEVLARLDRLEAEVAGQREALLRLARGSGVSGVDGVVEKEVGGVRDRPGVFGGFARIGERYGDLLRAEWWFTRGGVVLLLLGLAFLFKLSVDEGWITPAVRVLFGVGLGGGLILGGRRVSGRRLVVGQAMMGGGVAALYASGFAAHSLYSLVPFAVAFLSMVGVTGAAFWLAVRQDVASLAVIGVTGGLATPFLLYNGDGSIVGAVVYTCVVLGGAAAIYLYRGWTTLLVPACLGAVVSLTAVETLAWVPDRGQTVTAALLAGVVFCWIASSGVPVLRSVMLRVRRTAQPSPVAYLVGAFLFTILCGSLFGIIARFGATEAFGLTFLGAAVLHAAVAYLLHRSDRFRDSRTVYAQGAAGICLANIGLALTLAPWTFFAVITVEAVLLLYWGRRSADDPALLTAHGLFAALAVRAAFGLISAPALTGDQAPWAMPVATLFGTLVAFSVGRRMLSGVPAFVYMLAAHVVFLAWLLNVISPLPNGGMLVTTAWGVYGAGLLVASLRLDGGLAFKVAVATLLFSVAKLFAVDLFWVEAAYRISLFLGFGALFLSLGYYLRSLWRPTLQQKALKESPGTT
ncbi:DUF2339 domain-containing protein [Rubrobacter indicoceani]|uniref:DUF2339 domain-containing protein n=1 Tax=Rubrobacter indicoceani TaxID=2051957 RepID=UPI000E5BA96A|nr:DUF2339 domain-containing protein [Rubrobacter indicoceani]